MLCDCIPQDLFDPHSSYLRKKEERLEGNLLLLAVVFGIDSNGITNDFSFLSF